MFTTPIVMQSFLDEIIICIVESLESHEICLIWNHKSDK